MWGEKMKDAWVLRLKEESKDSDMVGDYYFYDNDESDWVTDDLQKATIYDDKDAAIESMKVHEKVMLDKFGKDAIMNFGYTNMMENFEWAEVEITYPFMDE